MFQLIHSLGTTCTGAEAFLATSASKNVWPFVTQPSSSTIPAMLHSSSNDDQDTSDGNIKKTMTPQQFGFDQPSKRTMQGEKQNFRVDLVDDVDSVTLTAIGFGLIALNFLVFANLGDGGIGGVVATIINTMKD
ncbi:hypothetical protein ACA910_011453 [Epithemia clementina (nom. ined.)]